MSFLKFLGLTTGDDKDSADPNRSSVEDIARRLEAMEPQRAQWLASFAMVLARAARADLQISEREIESMRQTLRTVGELSEEQAQLVAAMAAQRNQIHGASDDYLATREFRRVAADGDGELLLHCLFALAAADDGISLVEEEELRQVATELGIEHKRFTTIRSRFREQRTVLKGLPDPTAR